MMEENRKVMYAYLCEKLGNADYAQRLQDFTTEEVKKVIRQGGISDCYQLFRRLYNSTDEPEAQAHVLGFASAKARADLIAEIQARQAKLKD